MSDTSMPSASNKQTHPSAASDALVVGGGLAGSTAAAVLARAGMRVALFDAAAAHRRHLAAALTPVISSDDNVRSKLSRLGARLAGEFWEAVAGEVAGEVARPCGAIQLQRPEGAKRAPDLKSQAQAFAQPEWARWVEPDEASALAGLPLPRGGIWYPGGWLVRVPELITTLQSTAHVNVHQQAVERIESTDAGWLAIDSNGAVIGQAKVVVLTNAFDVLGLLQRSQLNDTLAACDRLPKMHRLAGEVTALPAAILGGGPKCIVGGDGYVLPAVDGWCVSGGTYVRHASQAMVSDDGREANIQRARDLLGMDVNLPTSTSLPGWAGWRAVLPGRLPAIGALPNAAGLWVSSAGASRGLTWSVLGAQLIRDQIGGEYGDWPAEIRNAIRP
jgi:tRNA 5-methylaminomethyl-2-thiouridine biosynthesis bifunctional protein